MDRRGNEREEIATRWVDRYQERLTFDDRALFVGPIGVAPAAGPVWLRDRMTLWPASR